jgi:hypothetical protein
MTRSISSLFALVACAVVPMLAVASYSGEAQAQRVWVGPPAAYVASYTPYYYNGYAHYYYGNQWYYRDHGAWRGYDHEPGALHDQRGGWGGHRHGWR